MPGVLKRAAAAARHVAEFVVCSPARRPIPLAARGLAAVLARVGPAGAVVDKCVTGAGNADC
jgi:hypothetical protein